MFMICNKKISRDAARILRTLNSKGYSAYIVGGAVRDLILNLEPKDYDIATSATPEQVKRIFRNRSRIIGRRFRLVHVYSGNEKVEVSTYRRMPTLRERKTRKSDSGLIVWRDNYFGTLEEDANRRDFTVNAIYYNPLIGKNGIVDNVGGIKDLSHGLIRAIGEPKIRIEEDPVRMLRVCKLVGQYKFSVEKNLYQEIKRSGSQILSSSRARLLEELYKIFQRPFTYPTLKACFEYGILNHLLPQFAKNWQSESGKKCLQALKLRDQKLKKGQIFPSRTSGFSIMLLTFFEKKLATKDFESFSNTHVEDAIKSFFSPFKLPRIFKSKIHNVLRMQPYFLNPNQGKKVLGHPNFQQAKETFSVFTEAMGYTSGVK